MDSITTTATTWASAMICTLRRLFREPLAMDTPSAKVISEAAARIEPRTHTASVTMSESPLNTTIASRVSTLSAA
jgi:hypothetical protein